MQQRLSFDRCKKLVCLTQTSDNVVDVVVVVIFAIFVVVFIVTNLTTYLFK